MAEAKDSQLKDTKTPVKQQQSTYDMPSTPGSKPEAGLEDGLLSASPEQLPANLMLLHHLLGALYVTMPLVKSRSNSTTYQNLRVPVQNFTGRDFQVTHIQQIKALCPEALGWEHILITNPTSKKQEQQLLLKLPVNAGNSKQSADTAQMQQLFFKRVQQHMLKHKRSRPPGELPPLAGPNARDCTPNRRPINLDLLPGTPQTAPTAGAAARTRGSADSSSEQLLVSPPPKRAATSMKPSGLGGLMSPPPTRTRSSRSRQAEHKEAGAAGSSSGAASTRRHHTPVRSREGAAGDDDSAAGAATPGAVMRPSRLFGTPTATATPQQQASTGLLRRPADMHATPAQAAGAVAATPEVPPLAAGVKVRKLTFDSAVKAPAARGGAGAAAAGEVKAGGIKFELGGSALALLEKVASSQVQQERADRAKDLQQLRALDMLPGTFDVLRAVFGDKGPCVKPKARWVSRVGFAGWPAAAAPDKARSSGIAAAAEALAAEQRREQQEAADLAAAEAAAAAAAAAEAEQASDDMVEDADELNIVDQAGLDILAELGGGNSSASGSSPGGQGSSSRVGVDGVSDEARMLLGGGTGSSKAAAAGASRKSSDDAQD
ncbi:hypothetical protein COO60DRAFT_1632643 [Scenedesmus sp. NREL 46B-D3]|nr:hypothetical protein COO60DRAFT_1632643 [Scenedesmus sp. NREL 46B-D3]